MEEAKPILRKLVRAVMQCCYQPAEICIVELIVKEKCVDQEEFIKYLKFDKRLVDDSLEVLRKDRILHSKTLKVTDSNGKSRRVVKYFIKYGELLNVVKYKLDNVRKLVETLERDATTAKTFKCTRCSKPYTDMEAGELFSVKSLKYCCILCRKPVQGDVSTVFANPRVFLAKFNEETEPIFDLIRKAEGILGTE